MPSIHVYSLRWTMIVGAFVTLMVLWYLGNLFTYGPVLQHEYQVVEEQTALPQ